MSVVLEILHWTATAVGALVILAAAFYYVPFVVGGAVWIALDWLDERPFSRFRARLGGRR